MSDKNPCMCLFIIALTSPWSSPIMFSMKPACVWFVCTGIWEYSACMHNSIMKRRKWPFLSMFILTLCAVHNMYVPSGCASAKSIFVSMIRLAASELSKLPKWCSVGEINHHYFQDCSSNLVVLINLPRCSISCMYFFLPEKCSLSATGSNKVSTTMLWIPSLISLYCFAMIPLCMGQWRSFGICGI